jgi:putative NADH-flavin reductase
MKILVLGGNGATGYYVVKQLLENNVYVKTIVRNPEKLKQLENQKSLNIIIDSILGMNQTNLLKTLEDVDAVVSCLGHNITFKGIWGKPHEIVVEAIKKIYETTNIKEDKFIKLILLNTTACLDTDSQERFTPAEKIVMTIMRFLLPPQKDNEKAVNYIKNIIGINNPKFEWIAVRPDTLVNEDEITNYIIKKSPVRSPIFNAGNTSRINVGNFITRLLCDNEQWKKWKYQMPVIYNEEK